MKFLLGIIICSSVVGECMNPFPWPDTFPTHYDCVQFGYKEAIKKLEEIGRSDVNEYGVVIKFTCTMMPGTVS